jgi:hypothetical protein
MRNGPSQISRIAAIVLLTINQAIRKIHINLVDLVDRQKVVRFPTEKALSKYSIDNDKICPRWMVPKGSLLEKLLRHIFNPGGD